MALEVVSVLCTAAYSVHVGEARRSLVLFCAREASTEVILALANRSCKTWSGDPPIHILQKARTIPFIFNAFR